LTAETSKKASAIHEDLNGSLETIANLDDSLPTFDSAQYDSKCTEDRYTTQQIIDAFTQVTPSGLAGSGE